MSRYLTDPPVEAIETKTRPALLLVNLGTPEEPTASAVKSYLREFLSDPRVVEIPGFIWKPILHGIVLNTRPRKSAEKYAAIWRKEGSPLRVYTQRQTQLLKGLLGERYGGDQLSVRYAMRYGRPSIVEALNDLKAEGCERIVVLPLYPQYAASTSATVFDVIAAWSAQQRNVPGFRFLKHFHDHPAYIKAFGDNIRAYWKEHGRPDKLLMSFHGLPRYTHERGDPYFRQCEHTAALLAAELELRSEQWQLSFQSRFGRAEWLQPYTATTLEELAHSRTPRVDVVCPGFVSDCLETLEEIGLEGKTIFLQAGGREFHLIPCLNDREDWIAALARIAEEQLGGWLSPKTAAVRNLNAIR